MSNTSVNTSGVVYCGNEIPIGFIWMQVVMLLCFFMGTPAHSWFLWLSFRSGWKIKPTQVFSLVLTVMDLIFCLHLSVNAFNVFIFLNNIISLMSLFIFALSWGFRLLIQVCICIEQYLAVIHPVTFIRYKAVHYRTALAAAVWMLSIGYGLLLVTAELRFPDYVFSSASFIGLIVISFCCMSVLCALKRPGPGEREITKDRGRDVGNQQKRNAFKAISNVLLIVLFSYLPLALIPILCIMTPNKKLFDCNIIFIMITVHIYCVMVAPLLKLHKEGLLKCKSTQKENQSG